MSTAQKRSVDISDLAAALGSNVVRFSPPPVRDEAQPPNPEWVASLDLIEEAAALFRATENRAYQAEDRADKVATKAMEGLKTAQVRVAEAEARVAEAEQQAADQIRLARAQAAEAETWARDAEGRAREAEDRSRDAEERAREAESRAEAAEARARTAEEWLARLTEQLRQKLSFAAQNAAADEYLLRRSA
jgi:hypothetical protein